MLSAPDDGRRPAKTMLVRPVGHISRSPPPRRTFYVRRCPRLCYGGAPVRECGGVDVNTQHDVSIGLESLFHFLGHPQPFFPARWHLVAIVEKLQQRWIIFLLDPIGPDCGRRLILGVRHTCSPCRCCLSLTRSRRVAASN